MAITVTGSTLSVTLSNATDLELGGHLTWSADDSKDIGASGANRPRTGYFGTSVVSPALTNAGTLALSATGANVITLSTNGSERVRVTSGGKVSIATTDELSSLTVSGDITLRNVGSGNIYSNAYYDGAFRYAANGYATFVSFTGNGVGDIDFLTAPQNSGGAGAAASFTSRVTLKNGGNLLVGTTTDDGSSKLQVAGATTTYDLTVYDPVAVTGSTSLVVRAGAGQSTNMLQTWQDAAAATLSSIDATGKLHINNLFITGDIASFSGISDGDAVLARTSGTGSGVFATAGSLLYRARAIDAAGYGDHIFYTGATPAIRFQITADNKIGFFGVTPVARAAALTAADAGAVNSGDATTDGVITNLRTRLGEIATALVNYGFIAA